jgi:hypothetical protein
MRRFVVLGVCLLGAALVPSAGRADESRPLADVARSAAWQNAEVKDGVVHVALDMGRRRVNWNHARWAVLEMAEPADLSAWDGLSIRVETDQPRTDAWVDVALMEDDGSWYYVRDAAPLSTKARTARVDFAAMKSAEFVFDEAGTATGTSGNFDEDFSLDLGKIARLAVGVVNPHGVGEVAFRVTGLDLVTWKARASERAAALVTGRPLEVNGADRVPVGLFGFHQVYGKAEAVKDLRCGCLRPHRAMGFGGSFFVPPEPENNIFFTINCQYDRKNDMPQAQSGDWEAKARAAGRALGEKAKPYGPSAVIEWWNEPYLELGRRLAGALRVKAPADAKAGDPVRTNYGRVLESVVWTSRGEGMGLAPRDPTMFSHWSGRQIAIFYVETFLPMAEEVKKIAPEVRLVPGWGFRWQEDDWAAWHVLYKPVVDQCIRYADGINEHHYQGHTEAIPAAYEVLNGYTVAKFGRPMPCYNTETNDLWDIPARGRPQAEAQAGVFVSRRRCVYNLRDILGVIIETPDKAASRAIHALWAPGHFGNDPPWGPTGIEKGEYICLDFLKDLRGRLVEARSDDRNLWVASSLDEAAGSLVVVLFNDGPAWRKYDLSVRAPEGTEFVSARRTELVHDRTGMVASGDVEEAAGGKTFSRSSTLGPSFASKTVLKLKGQAPAKAAVVRRQFFCAAPDEKTDPILFDLKPGQTVRLPLRFGGKRGTPKRAWLRLVVERLGEGEGYVQVAGRRLSIPAAYTPFNTPMIREIELDPRALADEMVLVFGAEGPDAGDGFLLCMASVVVED